MTDQSYRKKITAFVSSLTFYYDECLRYQLGLRRSLICNIMKIINQLGQLQWLPVARSQNTAWPPLLFLPLWEIGQWAWCIPFYLPFSCLSRWELGRWAWAKLFSFVLLPVSLDGKSGAGREIMPVSFCCWKRWIFLVDHMSSPAPEDS